MLLPTLSEYIVSHWFGCCYPIAFSITSTVILFYIHSRGWRFQLSQPQHFPAASKGPNIQAAHTALTARRKPAAAHPQQLAIAGGWATKKPNNQQILWWTHMKKFAVKQRIRPTGEQASGPEFHRVVVDQQQDDTSKQQGLLHCIWWRFAMENHNLSQANHRHKKAIFHSYVKILEGMDGPMDSCASVLLWCLQKGRKHIEGSHRPDMPWWFNSVFGKVERRRASSHWSMPRGKSKIEMRQNIFLLALHRKTSIKWTKVPGVGSSHLWRPGGWSLMAAKMRCEHHASES